MNSVVIEHVPVAELPAAWRDQLDAALEARVTVRIEPQPTGEAAPEEPVPPEFADDPSFGMWRDREDMADVAAYMRRVRAPRFLRHGLPDES
jgi:hypothetical protein